MIEDIKEIQKQFNKVLTYSQKGLDIINTDEIFNQWYKAKEWFIQKIDGLIYEFPEEVSFELTEETKNEKIKNFIDKISAYNDCSEYFNLFYSFLEMNKTGFYSNQVVASFALPDGTIIKKGMKLFRAFKFFIKDKELLNEAQSAASILIQENKFKGHMCLSVHPLDFISASENNYNWRSCHALDGDYRAGNISYMLDSSTIMCYIKGNNNNEILPNFPYTVPWNSKKWRVWIFFSDDRDMLFAGRQYPFTLSSALDFAKDKLISQFFGTFELKWYDDRITEMTTGNYVHNFHSPYVPIDRRLMRMDNLIKDAEHSLHYNDLLYSHYYIPQYTFKTYKLPKYGWGDIIEDDNLYLPRIISHKEPPHFYIGGGFKCLRCGEKYVQNNETMLCPDCEIQYGECLGDDYSVCPCCGGTYWEEDGYWVEGSDEYVCPDCYHNMVSTCDCCGIDCLSDDLVEYNGIYICQSCYDERNED